MAHRTVESVMTPVAQVVSVRPGTPYKEVVKLLTQHAVSAVPVLGEAGHVLGVVSEADLLFKETRTASSGSARAAISPKQALSRHKAEGATAVELMTAPAVTIRPDEQVAAAARRLEEHRIKRMPVVDGEGRLVGIVSRRDLLRVFLRTDREMEAELRSLLVDSFWIDPNGWSARVSEGRVLLSGRMDRRSTVRIAESAARRIDGVVAVDNELTYTEDDSQVPPVREVPFKGVFAGLHRSGGRH
ncbi:CBS domain-containing protein [Actinocrinis puniceicyclus]|uniref:CBS domain-containing protein n=1 Tax=Actinocrinis puniceicyclus TaxID=977794 RepID=A0A8J7WHP0_9ACTN|nr:CBS domain-containing protein [Actinocrinis puniceicyclus]MBS2961518.1 CBS domain-containing protein [Actinocrinis puniceicyclus]